MNPIIILAIVVGALALLLGVPYFLRNTGEHSQAAIDRRHRAERPECGLDEKYVSDLHTMNNPTDTADDAEPAYTGQAAG